MKFVELAGLAHAFWRIKFHHARIPIFAGYAVTNHCDADCLYCDKAIQTVAELSPSESRALLLELADMGTRFITLTGGEAFLRQDLGDLLEVCASRNIVVTVNTNGSLVAQRAELLPLIANLNLSLDGRGRSNSLRNPSSYDDVMTAANLARQRGRRITFSTVIHNYNVDNLSEMIEIAKSFNTIVTFQPISVFYNGARHVPRDIIPRPQAMHQALSLLLQDQANRRHIGNSPHALRSLLSWPYKNVQQCKIWNLFVRVEPDGKMLTCGRTNAWEEKFEYRTYGAAEAFSRVTKPHCYGCWCASMIELALLTDLNLASFKAALRRVL